MFVRGQIRRTCFVKLIWPIIHVWLVWILHNPTRRRLTSIGLNRDLITATAVVAGVGSFVFGFFTNLPVALA